MKPEQLEQTSRSCTDATAQDHDLKPMDEVTIGHGFDGLNRVVKLGSIITQFEAGDGGPNGFSSRIVGVSATVLKILAIIALCPSCGNIVLVSQCSITCQSTIILIPSESHMTPLRSDVRRSKSREEVEREFNIKRLVPFVLLKMPPMGKLLHLSRKLSWNCFVRKFEKPRCRHLCSGC